MIKINQNYHYFHLHFRLLYINFKRLNFTYGNRYIQNVIPGGLLSAIKRERYFVKRSVKRDIL